MKRVYQQPQLQVVILEESDCIATSQYGTSSNAVMGFSVEGRASKEDPVLGNERNHPIWDD